MTTLTALRTETTIEDPFLVAARLLGSSIAGRVILPADDGYDTARQVHSLLADRRPAVIVRPLSSTDVSAALRLAREHALPVAVRSGGHDLAAKSVADGAVVVDLSEMKGMAIDPIARLARLQPGVTSGAFGWPANAHGLALPTGDAASVAVGGLTLGGGIGWLGRKHGLTIDSLRSATLVKAGGEIVTASPTENPDLFWAIRGGGGNFGIVTEYTFALSPVGTVLGGALVLPATRRVVRGVMDYALAAPDELTIIASLMHAPPAPFIPQDRVGEPVLMVLPCYAGDPQGGERVIAPLRGIARPIADTIGEMPYPAMYNLTAAATRRSAAEVRSTFLNALPDALIDAALLALERVTSPTSQIQIRPLGGAIARVPATETAYAHRSSSYLFTILGTWLDTTEGVEHRAWVNDLWRATLRHRAGAYVNFLGNEGPDRVIEAYGVGTYTRLAAIKRRHDPDNVFRLNQNIPPSGR